MLAELREHITKRAGTAAEGIIAHIEDLEGKLTATETVQANQLASYKRVAEQEIKKASHLNTELGKHQLTIAALRIETKDLKRHNARMETENKDLKKNANDGAA